MTHNDKIYIRKIPNSVTLPYFIFSLLAHAGDKMAEFDLTTRMGQYLDRHLVFPLLEFLSVKEVTYTYADIDKSEQNLDHRPATYGKKCQHCAGYLQFGA